MVSLEDIKLPPHNIEAEKWTLAGIFLDNEVLYLYEWTALDGKDFYKKEHWLIYDAIATLWARRRTIDVVTIWDELTKMGELDYIWWTDYLYDISTYLLTTAWCTEYAKIVKEKSILRRVLKVCQHITGDVFDQKDTMDIMASIEKRIFDLTQISVWEQLIHIKDILSDRIDDYMDIIDNPDRVDEKKVMSQYKWLDDKLWWFKPWELIILAARPAMGKTAFALNLVINSAISQNKSVAFFSLEMTSQQLVDRIISTVWRIPAYKITKWQLTNDDFHKMGEAIEQLGDSDIYIDDSGAANVMQMQSKLRRLKIEKWRLDLVVIDYMQLMNGTWAYAWNRVQEVSQISRGLKELWKELGVPIIALSQLSRMVEQRIDKKPQLSDLRESWSIEQDADVVMMIHREDYYDPDTDRKWATDILIRKNRHGEIGEVELMFVPEIMRFKEVDGK